MSDSSSPKIIIVGASVAGLTLALPLLHHANPSLPNTHYSPTDIRILESRAPDAKAGGAIVLAPNALRILDKLGVYSKLRTRGYDESYNVFRNSQGEKIGEYPFGGKDAFGYEALRIARPAVLDVLRAEWMSRGGKIEFETSLREILRKDESGVSIRVRRGRTGGGIIEELRAGFLVGADGVHSKTRTFVLGHEVQPVYGGTVVIGVKALFSHVRFGSGFEECIANDERCLAITTESGTPLMVASDPAGEDILWIRQFPAAARNREGWEAFEADKTKLAEMMKQDQGTGVLPEVVDSLIEQVEPEECYIWAVHTLPALARWISPGGRAVIIGDAAHTVIPAAGQGAGQAIEDAYSLAAVLGSNATAGGMQMWQGRRMRKVERVARLGLQLLNLRLPPAERAKLPTDQVFDLNGSREEMSKSLQWLYGDDSTYENESQDDL